MSTLTAGLIIKKAKPTLKHRLAITPGFLGTVYAVNAEGVARYFDYDYRGARAWSGLDTAKDIRLARPPRKHIAWIKDGDANPRDTDLCYWVAR